MAWYAQNPFQDEHFTNMHTPVQVDMIPNDAYGLALYALDKTYSPKPKTGLTGTHAFNLNVSPFSSSKSKHAAICSAVGRGRQGSIASLQCWQKCWAAVLLAVR
jgi:hypothetical protein